HLGVGDRVLRLPEAADALHRLARHLADTQEIRDGLRLLVDQRLLVGGIAADADADQRDLDVVAEEARDHAAMGAGAARADDDGIERQTHVRPLLLHLLHAGDIAQTADRVRAAAGYDVALAAERGD